MSPALNWTILLVGLFLLFMFWSWIPIERFDRYWKRNNEIGRPFLNTMVITGLPALVCEALIYTARLDIDTSVLFLNSVCCPDWSISEKRDADFWLGNVSNNGCNMDCVFHSIASSQHADSLRRPKGRS